MKLSTLVFFTMVMCSRASLDEDVCQLFSGPNRDRFKAFVNYIVAHPESNKLVSGLYLLFNRKLSLIPIKTQGVFELFNHSNQTDLFVNAFSLKDGDFSRVCPGLAGLNVGFMFTVQGEHTIHPVLEDVLCFYNYAGFNITCLLDCNVAKSSWSKDFTFNYNVPDGFKPGIAFQYAFDFSSNKRTPDRYKTMLLEQKPVYNNDGRFIGFLRAMRHLIVEAGVAEAEHQANRGKCKESCRFHAMPDPKLTPIEQVIDSIPNHYKIMGVYNHIKAKGGVVTFVFLSSMKGNFVCRSYSCGLETSYRAITFKPDCVAILGEQPKDQLGDDWWSSPQKAPNEFNPTTMTRGDKWFRLELSAPLDMPRQLERFAQIGNNRLALRKLSWAAILMILGAIVIGTCCVCLYFYRNSPRNKEKKDAKKGIVARVSPVRGSPVRRSPVCGGGSTTGGSSFFASSAGGYRR